MLLASIYLRVWDLPAFMPIIMNRFHYQHEPLRLADHRFWTLLGLLMVASIVVMGLLHINTILQLGTAFAEGLIGFIIYMIVLHKKGNVRSQMADVRSQI
jgi:hypothetical protein